MDARTLREAIELDSSIKAMRKDIASARNVLKQGFRLDNSKIVWHSGDTAITISSGADSQIALLERFIKEHKAKINRCETLLGNL